MAKWHSRAGAMVGISFRTNRLAVQFLLYVAITVMTRSLAITAATPSGSQSAAPGSAPPGAVISRM